MAIATARLRCSFCGHSAEEVAKLVAGPGVYICDGCVALCVDVLDADLPVKQPTVPEWAEMTDEALLGALPGVAATTANIEAGLQDRVSELRQRGVSWARIGAALGMTRQSAWERFASRTD